MNAYVAVDAGWDFCRWQSWDLAHQRVIVDAAGKDSWVIAETVVAEEMLRFAGVIVADLEAFGDRS